MMKVTLAVVALAALTAAASGVLHRRVAILQLGLVAECDCGLGVSSQIAGCEMMCSFCKISVG